MSLLAEIGYQERWLDVVTSGFMRSAFIGGSLVALAAGLIGYYVVVRRNAFAAHALAHIGFPGATGAVLVGLPTTAGLAVFCVGGALVIGLLGRRLDEREVATGTVLAFATGLGVLFSSSSLAGRGTANVTNVLFGNLLAIEDRQLVVFAAFTALLVAVLAMVARPLMFASVANEVAEARGVPVRALNILFLVLLGLVVTMAVQVVGTLLLFSLVVSPAAAGLALTARPVLVSAISTAVAVASVLCGLVLAAMFNLPPSFVIVTLSTSCWAVAVLVRGRLARARRRRAPVPA